MNHTPVHWLNCGVSSEFIFIDKQSGKDFLGDGVVVHLLQKNESGDKTMILFSFIYIKEA